MFDYTIQIYKNEKNIIVKFTADNVFAYGK